MIARRRASRYAAVVGPLTAAAALLVALGLALAGCSGQPVPLLRTTAAPVYTFTVRLDEMPAAGAVLYADGEPLVDIVTGATTTDASGRLAVVVRDPGSVVALQPVALVTTTRPEHDWVAPALALSQQRAGSAPNWQYQVYLTSLSWDQKGQPAAASVSSGQAYTLTLSRQRPLILLNLLVSIEWDATKEYLSDFAEGMRHASTYLWDLTDGQMAFAQVRIVDQRQSWRSADIQVLARNTEHPHASIGGMAAELQPENYRVQIGPFWSHNLTSRNGASWKEPDGFRTIAHELGHYVLGLYDEYVPEGQGNEYEACTDGPIYDDDVGASAMNWQYETSEFSAHEVDGIWTDSCYGTMQWLFTEKAGHARSAWDSIVHRFSSLQNWEVIAPVQAMAGPKPDDWPQALNSLPSISPSGNPPSQSYAPFTVVLRDAEEAPVTDVHVRLVDSERQCSIDLGAPDAKGHLLVLGGGPTRTLWAEKQLSAGKWLCGALQLTTVTSPTETLIMTEASDACKSPSPPCQDGHYSRLPGATQFLVGSIDLDDRSQVTWEFLAGEWQRVSFDGQQVFDGWSRVDETQIRASAIRFLQEQPTADVAQVSGILACLPYGEHDPLYCLPPLDIGIAAYPADVIERIAQNASPPLSLPSSDGRLQVYWQASGEIDDLFILDSPLPPEYTWANERTGASRLYTLGGNWSELQIQMQSHCCGDSSAGTRGDGQRPALFGFVEGARGGSRVESAYAVQEGYVLAVIASPGSYALLR